MSAMTRCLACYGGVVTLEKRCKARARASGKEEATAHCSGRKFLHLACLMKTAGSRVHVHPRPSDFF